MREMHRNFRIFLIVASLSVARYPAERRCEICSSAFGGSLPHRCLLAFGGRLPARARSAPGSQRPVTISLSPRGSLFLVLCFVLFPGTGVHGVGESLSFGKGPACASPPPLEFVFFRIPIH